MLTPDAIHERIAAHVEAALANPTIAGAWRQSRHTYERFPGNDALDLEHHGFAIQLPQTLPDPGDRQHRPTIRAETTIRIRWAHRLRADATVVDTLEALKAEVEFVHQLRRIDGNPNLALDVLDLARSTALEGLAFVGEVGLRVMHLYPL